VWHLLLFWGILLNNSLLTPLYFFDPLSQTSVRNLTLCWFSLINIIATDAVNILLLYNSWVDTNANSTDDDGLDEDDDAGIFPPYRPDGYFCDLSRTDGNNDSDVIVGLCRACLGSSDRCLDDHNVLNNSTTSPITIKGGALEMASIGECREQCGVETNICSSTQWSIL
jgi:hypothetical protein